MKLTTVFAETPECKSRGHCFVCRDLERGRNFRAMVKRAWTVPGNIVDFECPHGLEWGVKKNDPRTQQFDYKGPLSPSTRAAIERQKPAPFTPATPPAEIVPLLGADHPGADRWTKWNNVREAYRLAMADFVTQPLPDLKGEGRGICILAGGSYLCSGYVTVRLLREHYGCTLPIEWVHGPHEMPDWQKRLLDGLDVTFLEAPCIGWAAKTWAILNCKYRKVIYLDADSEPLADPAFLLDSEPFARHGAIFWPDNYFLSPSDMSRDLGPAPFEALGIPFRDEWAFESGQIVIDKERCHRALMLADWMNRIHGAQYYWRLWFGDKEAFHMAWRYLGLDYAMPAHRWDAGFPSLLQHDPTTTEKRYIFSHNCPGKRAITCSGWKAWTRKPAKDPAHMPPHEAIAESYVSDLQKHWDATRPRFHALTVCVDFGDRLAETLRHNRRYFDSYTVVTIARDTETQEVCAKHDVRVVLTDKLYLNGSRFDKGAAINDGLRLLYAEHSGDWLVHIDADMIMPAHLAAKLCETDLQADAIHGMRREGHSSEERFVQPISGFFQLWHASQQRFYKEGLPDAGHSDIHFRDQWPQDKQITLDLTAQHLGEPGVDWRGRVSPRMDAPQEPFDGPAVWAELSALPFLPDLSIVPQRVNEIVAKLPRFSCSCQPGAVKYLAANPIDISSPLALARYIWRWHNWVNRKLHKPEKAWEPAAAQHGWDKLPEYSAA